MIFLNILWSNYFHQEKELCCLIKGGKPFIDPPKTLELLCTVPREDFDFLVDVVTDTEIIKNNPSHTADIINWCVSLVTLDDGPQ